MDRAPNPSRRPRRALPASLARDERGVSQIIEFTLALTFFLFIIQAFAEAIDFRLKTPLTEDTLQDTKLLHLAGHLTRSPGQLDNNSVNDTAWETYPVWGPEADIANNLTVLGLAVEGSPGFLSQAKVLGLRKVGYQQAKELFGLTGYQLQFRLTLAGATEPFFEWGGDYRSGRRASNLARIVGLVNDTSTQAARFEIWLFQGATPSGRVVITEVMHSPPGGALFDQWVELYNPTEQLVDLTDWRLSTTTETDAFDATERRGAFLPGHVFALLITGNANLSSVRTELNLSNETLLFRLADSRFGANGLRPNETLDLENPRGFSQAAARYYPDEGADETNETMELINPEKKASEPGNWAVSQSGGQGGTPGRANSRWS